MKDNAQARAGVEKPREKDNRERLEKCVVQLEKAADQAEAVSMSQKTGSEAEGEATLEPQKAVEVVIGSSGKLSEEVGIDVKKS